MERYERENQLVTELSKAQAALDAERAMVKMLERGVSAQGALIADLQSQLATLKRLVWALPYQTGNITKLNVEGLTILDAQPFVDLLTYRATLEATPVAHEQAKAQVFTQWDGALQKMADIEPKGGDGE